MHLIEEAATVEEGSKALQTGKAPGTSSIGARQVARVGVVAVQAGSRSRSYYYFTAIDSS